MSSKSFRILCTSRSLSDSVIVKLLYEEDAQRWRKPPAVFAISPLFQYSLNLQISRRLPTAEGGSAQRVVSLTTMEIILFSPEDFHI